MQWTFTFRDEEFDGTTKMDSDHTIMNQIQFKTSSKLVQRVNEVENVVLSNKNITHQHH